MMQREGKEVDKQWRIQVKKLQINCLGQCIEKRFDFTQLTEEIADEMRNPS